jgi:ribosomal protein S18 acetylase RimI-like enzyme
VPTSTAFVRRAEPSEYDGVAELTARVYVSEGYASSGYEDALRQVASRDRSAQVLVALVDGAVAGAVTVATRGGEWAEQAVPGEAVIRMLVVDPAVRGSGTGEALVRACVERAREDGCGVVRLSTDPSMTTAHRLYERIGFARTPSYDWEPVPGVRLRGYALPLLPWCDHCGEALTPEGHDRCRRMAELDPPRWCAHCRRRMVVQVTPTGWTAKCVEHGVRASG